MNDDGITLLRLFRRCVVDTTTPKIRGQHCYVCSGANLKGYPQMHYKGRTVYASRLAWTLLHGEIPAGRQVLHRCDNPPCMEPDHWFLGTNADNRADSVGKNRHAKGEKLGRNVLTAPDILPIRKDPRASRKIAEDYGVSQTAIWAIKIGKTWKHIP